MLYGSTPYGTTPYGNPPPPTEQDFPVTTGDGALLLLNVAKLLLLALLPYFLA
jgi:hypothetical protein